MSAEMDKPRHARIVACKDAALGEEGAKDQHRVQGVKFSHSARRS